MYVLKTRKKTVISKFTSFAVAALALTYKIRERRNIPRARRLLTNTQCGWRGHCIAVLALLTAECIAVLAQLLTTDCAAEVFSAGDFLLV